jgi:ubiquinone/menaquinone biosynthesis C-methylase UbiE
MIHHGIGERIEGKVENNDCHQLLVLERHRFAYQQVIPHVKDKRVLEIGCGTAYGTRLLAEHADEVVALDIDAALIAQLAHRQTTRTTYQAYDGSVLPFPDGSFDAVVSFQVIEHVADDVGFLDEVKRVLKAHGRAFVTTPNRLLRLLPGQKPFNHYHTREYAPRELKSLASKAGFTVRLEGIFGHPSTQALEADRLRIYHHWVFRHIVQRLPRVVQQVLAQAMRRCSLPKVSERKHAPAHFGFFRVRAVDDEGIDQCIDLWLDLEKEPS